LGRISFSCAHELGHHQLGHGTQLDEYLPDKQPERYNDPAEYAADIFASHLLMPRAAVLHAFQKRSWTVDHPTPFQCFLIASEFGVGYLTLLNQLVSGLDLLDTQQLNELRKIQPKSIRSKIWAASSSSRLFVVDSEWEAPSADLEVDDFICAPLGCTCCPSIAEHVADEPTQSIFKAVAPGQSRLVGHSHDVNVRVSRRGYEGAFRFRYEEEPSP
tara:strand:- start:858 stop:1505 length:648 start_codon:yes stop_codon:yes gene_type:complete